MGAGTPCRAHSKEAAKGREGAGKRQQVTSLKVTRTTACMRKGSTAEGVTVHSKNTSNSHQVWLSVLPHGLHHCDPISVLPKLSC